MLDQLPLVEAVSAALNMPVMSLSPASGGDINDAFEAHLADGRVVFVKTNTDADPRMFACEARGLDWLREADAIRIPRVLAASGANRNSGAKNEMENETAGAGRPAGRGNDPPFLVLERIASAARARDYNVQL